MSVSRREFLRASSALAAALGLRAVGAEPAFAAEGSPSLVWLQAQACSGCSISLMNSLTEGTCEELLQRKIDLKYHPTLMAAAGPNAVAAAAKAREAGDYVLVVEGAIPTGAEGKYCLLWPGMTALEGVRAFAERAKFIVAVGTCASFGGISGSVPPGEANPTGAKSVSAVLGGKTVVNVSGCPPHPDWIVGTVASVLSGTLPARDTSGRPRKYYYDVIHEQCPYHRAEEYCLEDYGCKGPLTYSSCPAVKWNCTKPGAKGINWCMGAGSPCQGCTQPNFPDGMLPFHARVERRRGKGRPGF